MRAKQNSAGFDRKWPNLMNCCFICLLMGRVKYSHILFLQAEDGTPNVGEDAMSLFSPSVKQGNFKYVLFEQQKLCYLALLSGIFCLLPIVGENAH